MSEILIQVENISKKYCKDLKKSLQYGIKDILREVVGLSKKKDLRKDEFWALRNISFTVRRGECLGLIGHNGAGKSTLLKLLNGLIKPEEGVITMKGKIGALIELGAGFSPILTGRENIYINASILGFTEKEIDDQLDEIIAFSELSEFIDTPVQNYSSGMKVRLGFAIAAQMKPDILLIDEILAVGDMKFRMKCLNKISELLKSCAVIFISHSMPQISKVCNSSLLLSKGIVLEKSEDVSSVISEYFKQLYVSEESMIFGNGKVDILNISIFYKELEKEGNYYLIPQFTEFKVTLEFSVDKSIKYFFIKISVFNFEQKPVAETSTLDYGIIYSNDKEIHHIDAAIANVFNRGNFAITLFIHEIINGNVFGERLMRYQGALKFRSISKTSVESYVPVSLKCKWLNN